MIRMPRAIIVIFAQNEETRIARCLRSLPLYEPGLAVHVLVNGSTDRTAEIARRFTEVYVHEYDEPGKARSWNRFVLDEAGPAHAFVFMDGDARLTDDAIEQLLFALDEYPEANAVAGIPMNGRSASYYQQEIIDGHGMFADLYALRGRFVDRFRQSGIRLPEDLIGDDGLVGALAKTDLQGEDNWQDERIQPCPTAGFYCEPMRFNLASLKSQYRRMVSYSERHFQNRIVSDIMRGPGPQALPRLISSRYEGWLPRFARRLHPVWWWIDGVALKRMAASA